jgi:preprotein translocase subunit YajC
MSPILTAFLGQTAPEGAQQPSPLMTLFPFLAIAVVFYFIFFRPQQKQQKQLQETLSKLAKGNEVLTQGGIYGTVVSVGDGVVTLDAGGGTKLRVAQSSIVRDLTQEAARKASKADAKK